MRLSDQTSRGRYKSSLTSRIIMAVSKGERSSYDIIKAVEKPLWFLPKSLRYLVIHFRLDRLARHGLLQARWGEATPERGGHRRRYYRSRD